MSHRRRLISLSEAKPPFYVGIDLGGTNTKVGVVDDQGSTLSWLSVPTQVERGPEEGAQRMAQAALEAIKQAGLTGRQIARAGLGTPGTQDIAKGLLLTPSNLPGWWHFPIRDRVSERLGLLVSYNNDANAAAYGEFWVGIGKALHSMVLFTLGTGIGGGIIIGDLLVEGEHSAGGEVGHIIIDYNDEARVCSCGQRGHLEGYASATAVIHRTSEALDEGRRTSLTARLEAGAELTPLLVAEEAQGGDSLALEIIQETARYLAIGTVNVMHTINPSGVVYGGAMTFGEHETPLGRKFLGWVKEEVGQRAFPVLAAQTVIDYALLGPDAGYIGAAGIARQAYLREQAART